MRWLILFITILIIVVGVSSCSSPGRFADRNPHVTPKDTNAIDFFMMRWFGDDPWADQLAEVKNNPNLVPQVPIDLSAIQTPAAAPQITWLGHATFLLQYRGLTILTDPILSERASPLSFTGPERLTPAPLTVSELPPIDVVVISHNHYDHLDEETIAGLGPAVNYMVPLGLSEWFSEQGIGSERVHEFDWWQQANFGPLAVTATPSQHWSARSLWDKNETLWASWHLQIGDWQVWFGGDTGYNPYQFKEIGQRFPDIDDALIPVGAYLPRWFMQPQHVDPAEALQIHNDLGASRSYAMHWGTYQLAAESIEQTRQDLAAAKQKAKVPADHVLKLLAIGKTERVDTFN
ncbi:MBL fold metallo-hydrolase [Pseudidiomarina aquimaris]|uniref:MBL fold metallo-hydrolase n=1 Tax=Pseudidiomarina aquimaris TaxID=641841 RepID=A0A432XFV5_9GAMM|nr:MBL fold metallo-hydrolase [Pseudidiomarina aquimaris]RUO47659.1 MBL fold metallo-hydrolase [Pseudidiomarina aquimaris]